MSNAPMATCRASCRPVAGATQDAWPGLQDSALVIIPWMLYVYQGDTRILETAYPAMAYVDPT